MSWNQIWETIEGWFTGSNSILTWSIFAGVIAAIIIIIVIVCVAHSRKKRKLRTEVKEFVNTNYPQLKKHDENEECCNEKEHKSETICQACDIVIEKEEKIIQDEIIEEPSIIEEKIENASSVEIKEEVVDEQTETKGDDAKMDEPVQQQKKRRTRGMYKYTLATLMSIARMLGCATRNTKEQMILVIRSALKDSRPTKAEVMSVLSFLEVKFDKNEKKEDLIALLTKELNK